MSETRWTRGPWKVWPNHDLGHDREDEIVVGHGPAVVATVWPMGDDEAGINESVANAHVIALAPTMRIALEKAANALRANERLAREIDMLLARARGEGANDG